MLKCNKLKESKIVSLLCKALICGETFFPLWGISNPRVVHFGEHSDVSLKMIFPKMKRHKLETHVPYHVWVTGRIFRVSWLIHSYTRTSLQSSECPLFWGYPVSRVALKIKLRFHSCCLLFIYPQARIEPTLHLKFHTPLVLTGIWL